jgi:glycogen operon protein
VRRFTVRSPTAGAVWLCLFDGNDERRVAMTRDGADWHVAVSVEPGATYGFRTDLAPGKLLVDPRATVLDRPFVYDPCLSEPGADTAALVPRAIVTASLPPLDLDPVFAPGGLIYEVNVRGFTMRHPDVPVAQRGTIGALAHPSIVSHLKAIGVTAVELMPVTAWIDERHLPPLGLANAWGYNPVVPMALDPRLAPGGVHELRETVLALRAEGIGVILDLVLNHSGESDLAGPTLSFRGLDPAAYAHAPDGSLVNVAGTGNTFDFADRAVRDLALDTLRHFVTQCGVDGFRFDLAPILARGPDFDAGAPFLRAVAEDPLLSRRVMIAEPWDCAGYFLGAFPGNWLEWNDRYRDDVRRFWRGDGGAGALVTRLSGSTDVFGPERTRSVSFVAAHDGFTLHDVTAFAERHNHANGEDNRDGHHGEVSWNAGAEGEASPADARALLATLYATRGTIMLTAGDEFGRTQSGNNNAYAQDNATVWLDWEGRDHALAAYVADLASCRTAALADPTVRHDARWFRLDGEAMRDEDWASADGFEMRLPEVVVRVDRRIREVRIEPLAPPDPER